MGSIYGIPKIYLCKFRLRFFSYIKKRLTWCSFLNTSKAWVNFSQFSLSSINPKPDYFLSHLYLFCNYSLKLLPSFSLSITVPSAQESSLSSPFPTHFQVFLVVVVEVERKRKKLGFWDWDWREGWKRNWDRLGLGASCKGLWVFGMLRYEIHEIRKFAQRYEIQEITGLITKFSRKFQVGSGLEHWKVSLLVKF